MELKSLLTLGNLRAGTIPVAVLTTLLAACSGSGPKRDSGAEAPPPLPPDAGAAQANAPESGAAATESSAPEPAAESSAEQSARPVLAASAPQTYTVKRGDTLWDISKAFLRDPWLWPEIWYVNPQVENPHLIYPGDVLALAYGADGSPQVRLERGGATRLSPRIRSQPLEGPITAIPYEIVAAFMSKPTVLEKDQIRAAPYVLSSRDQHLITAAGNTIYARGGVDGELHARYSIVHVGEPLRDPDDNDVVGYEGHFAATARLLRSGDPATLELIESTRETKDGDKLFPGDADVAMDFIPHPPSSKLDGRIISIVNGVAMVGQYQVVVINRGQRDGLEPGHVLGIYQVGPKVRDVNTEGKRKRFGANVQLPDERAGTFMVFKTFDRISYGLIMETQTPVRVLDRVSNP